MKTPRRTIRSILAPRTQPQDNAIATTATDRVGALVAIAFAVLLLMLATLSQGAFATDRWAPLALFTLAILIGTVALHGRLAIRGTLVRVGLGGIWGLAGWSLVSMAWAQSPADALASAGEMFFYAAIVTLPFALSLSRRTLAIGGWAVVIGVGVIAAVTEIRLLTDGPALFLAGRLNGPINYRNATALLFAMPFWPFVIAAAARDYSRMLRAASLALSILCLGLVFLTQSRGILLGLAAGGCLTLIAGPDRVRRAWVAVLALATIAAASPELLKPYRAFDGGDGTVTAHSISVASTTLLVLTIIGFVLGMAIALFDRGLRAKSPAARWVGQGARGTLVVGAAAALIAIAIAVGNPVEFVNHKWNQFTNINGAVSTSIRYASVQGQRYDLWRVATKEFAGAPIGGVGAGSYQFDYYRYRRTDRNLDDPHSLLFSTLSETGLVGIALLVAFLGGLTAVLRRGWRQLAVTDRRHALAPIAAGVVMLGQSLVDWIWLIPGLTAIGLLALAVGAAQAAVPTRTDGEANVAQGSEPSEQSPRVVATAARVVPTLGLIAATLVVLALFLSDAYIERARSMSHDPRVELAAARDAGWFDPWSVTPHYLEASALETMGHLRASFEQLNDALELEPANSATLGVIGDFEVRRGNLRAARAYYRRALALDPLDSGLQQLAHYGTQVSR